jgi:hypothetical protein
MSDGIKSSSYLSLDLARPRWPRGGMVTQRIANPCIPVRFWAWPPHRKDIMLINSMINLNL